MDRVTVVSDQVGTFEVYGRTLRVSADTEVIVRFTDPRFDYLRYLDEEHQCLAIVRMHPTAYTMLVEFGIPETTPRTTMSQSEFNEWLEWETNVDMAQFEEEMADGQGSDESGSDSSEPTD